LQQFNHFTWFIVVILLLTQLTVNNIISQPTSIDSLKQVLSSPNNNAHKVKVLNDIGYYYAEAVKEDSALLFIDEAIEIATRYALDTLLAEAYYAKGYSYDYGGDLNAAFKYYDLSLQQYDKIGNLVEVLNCMNGKGVAAYFQGDYELALSNYLSALNYVDSTGITGVDKTIGNLLNNIGVIYRITDQTEEAIDIYQRGLTIYTTNQDSFMIMTAHQNIGVAYTHQNNLDSSIYHLDKSNQILELTDNRQELPSLLNAYAEAYYLCGQNYAVARVYVDKAEQLGVTLANQEYLSKIYLLKSQIESDDRKYAAAIVGLKKGFKIIEPTDRQDLKLDYYEQASLVYEQAGDQNQSLEYLQNYVALYKDVQSTDRVKAIADAQIKYESIEKEKEIERLRYEDVITSLRVSRQRWLLLLSGLSLFILGYLTYRMFRQKEEIQEKNSQISKALSEKEILLKEIHHRVKNNLQFISALLGLQTDHVSDEVALIALQEGQDRVQSMALIHQDLYQRDDLTSVNIKDYFIKLTEGLFDSYNIRTDDISLQLDITDLDLDVDTVVPIGLIVNELVSNSLKYAFADGATGVISVSLQELNDKLVLSVADTGAGMTQDTISNLGDSLGYKLIQALSAQLNGSYHIDGEQGGTIATIEINKYRKSAMI